MSELGPLSFGKKDEQIFLGREIAQHRDYSEATAIKIDDEVKRLVQKAFDRSHQIIEDQSDALVRIAEALLEREVLDGDEVMQLIEGEELPSPTASGDSGVGGEPTQEVIKPEGGVKAPPLIEGERPQPA
jgi:cell division protease FtsH